jgi:hypothetical protein
MIPPEWIISSRGLDTAQVAVALLLIGLAMACVPAAYLAVWRWWSRPRDAAAILLLVAIAAAAIARWGVAPLRMATIWVGFKITGEARDLVPLGHYGAGGPTLYHLLFAFFPVDHRVLMAANSVLGVLTVPFAATSAARLANERRVGAVAALLVAFTPMFIRNDNSDANNVPCLFWLLGGLVLWLEYLESGQRRWLVAGVPLLALGAITRPEMPLLVGLVLAGAAVAVRAPRARWRDPAVWIAAAALVGLMVPHLLHVLNAVAALRARSNLPGIESPLSAVRRVLTARNAVLRPDLFPIAALACAAVALVAARGRRVFALGALAIAAIAIYYSDTDGANMARVAVPGALLATMLAAIGVVRLWDLRHPVVRSALVLGLAVSAGATVPRLFAATNEETEEWLIRQAERALPQAPLVLVRTQWPDLDRARAKGGVTHLMFPDYLFVPPAREGKLVAVTEWLSAPDWRLPAFFFQGMRCYAAFRRADEPRPRGDDLHPACARMHQDFRLEPVFEEDVPNHGDVWLRYYGDAKTLRVGLYRVSPRG